MLNRRTLFAAIIKLLVMLGLLLLAIVFINSLFIGDDNARPKIEENPVDIVSLDIADIRKGQVKRVRWDNREVAILYRQFPEKLSQATVENSASLTNEKIHSSINAETRSIKNEYFVYFNVGDSKNCPLYYAGGVFKDTCSSNQFDESGRNISTSPLNYKLQIPPHYFDKQQLIFGKWHP